MSKEEVNYAVPNERELNIMLSLTIHESFALGSGMSGIGVPGSQHNMKARGLRSNRPLISKTYGFFGLCTILQGISADLSTGLRWILAYECLISWLSQRYTGRTFKSQTRYVLSSHHTNPSDLRTTYSELS